MSTISRLQVGLEYPVYREGLALISKYHIRSSDTLTLKKDDTDEHNRILQLIDVWVGNQIIRIGHVHFLITDFVDYATPHLEETLEILEARHEKRILIGDFNITPSKRQVCYGKMTINLLPSCPMSLDYCY